MKKITQAFWAAIMLLMSNSAFTQQAWVKHADVEKSFTTGGSIFSFVKIMDAKNASGSLSQYGYFNRTKAYNNYGNVIIQNLLDSNSVKRVNGSFTSAGKMNFLSSHSAIYAHDTIAGREYVGVGKNDSTGQLYAALNFLDVASNAYAPVGNLRFSSRITGFVYLGNNKVLVFGDFFEASDGITRQTYNGAAVWDISNNTLAFMSGGGIGSEYLSHSTGVDGATLILLQSGYGFRFVKQGVPQWSDGLVPGIPAGGRMIISNVVNQDSVFGVWQKDSVGYPSYLVKFIRSESFSWQMIGRLTSTSTSNSTRKTWVNSINLFKNKLYISTEATHLNGQLLGNNIFIVDPSSFALTSLPIPPTSAAVFEKSRLAFVSGKIYLIEDNGNLVLGTQRIYVLRDTTARLPPTITPLSNQINTLVTVCGTIPEPFLYIDLYNKVTGLKIGTTQSTAEGSWQIPVTLPEGGYTFWARARNEDTIMSPFSNIISFVVSFPTAVIETSNEDDIKVFPNPAKNFFFVKNAKEILRIVSVSGVIQSHYVVSKTSDTFNVSFNSFPSGLYFVEIKGKDGKKYLKKLVVQ